MAEHLAGACGGALRQAHGETPSGRRSGGTQQRPSRGKPPKSARRSPPCRLSPTVKAVDGRRPPGGRPGSHGLSRPARDRQRARPTWAGPGQGRPEAPPSHRQALAGPGPVPASGGVGAHPPRHRAAVAHVAQSGEVFRIILNQNTWGSPMRHMSSLTEQEILALAISLEEEHARIYADYADGLRQSYPASAAVFHEMGEGEGGHRRLLIEL